MKNKIRCPRCTAIRTVIVRVDKGLEFKCKCCGMKMFSPNEDSELVGTIYMPATATLEEVIREIEKVVAEYEAKQSWGVDKN